VETAAAGFVLLTECIGVIRLNEKQRVGHMAGGGEKRNVCRILVGRPDLKRPLDRHRRRRDGNIKIVLKARL
jgi:hypothetical protein